MTAHPLTSVSILHLFILAAKEKIDVIYQTKCYVNNKEDYQPSNNP
jgi:hypothetical protein